MFALNTTSLGRMLFDVSFRAHPASTISVFPSSTLPGPEFEFVCELYASSAESSTAIIVSETASLPQIFSIS